MGPTATHQRPTLRRFLSQAGVLTGIMLGSLSLYLAVEWWRGPDARLETQTAWDRHIPFLVGWVWPYLIPYLIGPVAAGFLSRATFAWYVRRGLPLVLVSLLIFIVVPTKTVRPDKEMVAGLPSNVTTRMYRDMADIDGPAANAAPSLHVSLTCLLVLALVRDYPRGWPIWLASAVVVWLSTLFTWQHHLIDVAAGVALACLFALPGRWRGRS